MEIRVLKYFLAVVREESITKAAEVLHITQPTLSRQLAQLEEERQNGGTPRAETEARDSGTPRAETEARDSETPRAEAEVRENGTPRAEAKTRDSGISHIGSKARGERGEKAAQAGRACGAASREMCTFLIINISSLQLIPVSMIAYRGQYGSAAPAAIVGPAVAATAVSTLVAVVFCKVMNRACR